MKKTSGGVMPIMPLGVLLALILFLAGCKLGPDYKVPEFDPAQSWDATSRTNPERFAEDVDIDLKWWSELGNTQLAELIERAVKENHEVAVARRRMLAARHLIGAAESTLLPYVGTSASSVQTEFSENFPGLNTFFQRGQLDTRQELFSASIDAAWELDLFGKNRRYAEAAKARAGVAEAVRRGAILTVAAEVARNYVQLQIAREQVAALIRRIGLNGERIQLIQSAVESGVLSEVSLAQARAKLKSLELRLPQTRAKEAAAIYRLAVLTNRQPKEMFEELAQTPALPSPPDLVPIGMPGDLLRRRPDVAQAERELAAATAEIGMAKARLYPSFSLTGSVGRQAGTFTNLYETGSGTWMIVPTIDWPVFQGGRLRSELAAVKQRHKAAQSAYRSSVLRAVAGVEGALSAYARAFESRKDGETMLRYQQEALKRIKDGHEAGVVSGLDELSASDRLAKVEQTLARLRGRVILNLITLNKELGGGWEFPKSDQAAEVSSPRS